MNNYLALVVVVLILCRLSYVIGQISGYMDGYDEGQAFERDRYCIHQNEWDECPVCCH
jgi:hypothetical protein